MWRFGGMPISAKPPQRQGAAGSVLDRDAAERNNLESSECARVLAERENWSEVLKSEPDVIAEAKSHLAAIRALWTAALGKKCKPPVSGRHWR